MKQDNRSSKPILTGAKLDFFYSILTLWESSEENKVVKNFKSAEVKRFLDRLDSKSVKILSFTTDKNKKDYNCRYELYVKNTKGNKGLSLFYHLRNAFAHNNISLDNNGNTVLIEHSWNGELKLKAKISFKVLNELYETIRGLRNLSPEEKKKIPKHKKRK